MVEILSAKVRRQVDDRKSILLLDTGREWGGGTNSLIELLKRLDKERYQITALFYHNYMDRRGTSSPSSLVMEFRASSWNGRRCHEG